MAFVKPIREQGIVISKEILEAREAGSNATGTVSWAARETEYVVEVMSCDQDDFSQDIGILNGTLAKYKVSKAIYDKVKFGMWASVKYTVKQFKDKLDIKTETLTLIDKQ